MHLGSAAKTSAGIDLAHVPYQGWRAGAAGRDAARADPARLYAVAPLIDAGKIR
jgi:hypothetical protein